MDLTRAREALAADGHSSDYVERLLAEDARGAPDRKLMNDRLNAAYSALEEYRTTPKAHIFNQYFMVAPGADYSSMAKSLPEIEQRISDGLIITGPTHNLPDNMLPDEAIQAKKDAVAFAMQAVNEVKPSHVSLLEARQAQAAHSHVLG